jgi:hypothetical protein
MQSQFGKAANGNALASFKNFYDYPEAKNSYDQNKSTIIRYLA